MVASPCEVSIIVPTFCEVGNLPSLIPHIAAAMNHAGLDYEVIVVDDDSQDGTVDECQRLAQTYPVQLVTRSGERGLATAVVCGLRAAQGEVLVVMDADGSHSPDAIAALVDRCRDPSIDFVIGSRYVPGGAVDASWSLWRRINSQVATMFARGLTSVRDPMAGFFALRHTTFNTAVNLQPLGYKIGLELIVRCRCQQVAELPIHFRDRARGNSKLGLDQQLLYLRHLARLYRLKFPTIDRAVRFGLVGLSGMVVDLAALTLLLTSLPLAVARLVSIAIAMTWNFALHRSVTFPSLRRTSIWRQYGAFSGACLLGAAVNWSVSLIAAAAFGSLPGHALVASTCGIFAGAIANFWLADRVVFRQANASEMQPVERLPEVVPLDAPVEPSAGRRSSQWQKSA